MQIHVDPDPGKKLKKKFPKTNGMLNFNENKATFNHFFTNYIAFNTCYA
jgi:hypothetical protein